MIRLSAVIITLNEERNLARCLNSVKRVADEIIVVDSMSTDNTVQIAESFGAIVYQHSFAGFVEQKRKATEYANNDWIISIDADEEVNPELEQCIIDLKEHGPRHDAYKLSRLTNYCGKWIKHSGWYPDRLIRIFNKNKGSWHGETVHESWQSHEGSTTGMLKGQLLHYSYTTITQHVKKIEKYTELGARDAVKNGKDCSLLKLIIVPNWKFFAYYIIRLGILDGYYGFIICKLESYASFVKYAKIRQYARMKRERKIY
jgi:glycosyltransferase involved in cell wall biosynthesis